MCFDVLLHSTPMYSSLDVWLLIALAMVTRMQANNGMHICHIIRNIVYAYCAASLVSRPIGSWLHMS